MTAHPILSLRNIRKERLHGAGFTLEIPRFTVRRGEKVALVGPSGCGKSTALDIIATVLRPDVDGPAAGGDKDTGPEFTFAPEGAPVDILAAWRAGRRDALAALRLRHMGYVLQTGGLLPFLTARANIVLGCVEGASAQLPALAQTLGISHLLDALPGRLSVGERQRVAIARALAANPCLVLADEPAAALDPINARIVMDIFTRLAEDMGITVIVVTHAPAVAAEMGFRLVQTALHREAGNVLARMGDEA